MGFEGKREEVAFNLGQSQLQLVGSLMQQSSQHYVKGEIESWFTALKAIKLNIIPRLNEEERRKLGVLERWFFDPQQIRKVLSNNKLEVNEKNIRDHRSRVAEKYDTMIKDLLEAKGFLVPLKEDRKNIFGQEDPDERVVDDDSKGRR
jgi:hypothetical protein|tara:strand:- start:3614 stop:4057 length:444 start_codon:yes stop_codon:yes gene_type:complete